MKAIVILRLLLGLVLFAVGCDDEDDPGTEASSPLEGGDDAADEDSTPSSALEETPEDEPAGTSTAETPAQPESQLEPSEGFYVDADCPLVDDEQGCFFATELANLLFFFDVEMLVPLSYEETVEPGSEFQMPYDDLVCGTSAELRTAGYVLNQGHESYFSVLTEDELSCEFQSQLDAIVQLPELQGGYLEVVAVGNCTEDDPDLDFYEMGAVGTADYSTKLATSVPPEEIFVLARFEPLGGEEWQIKLSFYTVEGLSIFGITDDPTNELVCASRPWGAGS